MKIKRPKFTTKDNRNVQAHRVDASLDRKFGKGYRFTGRWTER